MKVILEAQHACTSTPRGISYYSLQLIRKLLSRRKNEYELTFFDGNREMNNRQWIDKYFGEWGVPVYECNTLDYRIAKTDETAFSIRSYNDYTGAYGDVFHFLSLFAFPDNLIGKPIVTIHDMTPLRFPELCDQNLNKAFSVGLKRLKKMRPIIITDSEFSKNDILHYTEIHESDIHVVYISHDEKACKKKANPELLRRMNINFPYVLYVGAIAAHKNIERITDAFEKLAEVMPDVKLIIAGKADPKGEEVELKVKESRLYGKRIILTGYVTDEQKYALYHSAVAFVFPSLYEGFGLPVLEAMACGCPVITSNVSSLPEVAGDAAILVDPYDTEQLAHEMERVISLEALRKELRIKGLKQAEKFSWDKAAEMVEGVYRAAYERGRKDVINHCQQQA